MEKPTILVVDDVAENIDIMEKPTILVVDDVAENIDLMRYILKDKYKVKAALNGQKALDIVEKHPIDLILLDIMMPNMNGYDVIKKLKSNPENASIPVMFVTAMDEIDDETRGFELGAVDYITKPIMPNIVLARVGVYIQLSIQNQLLDNKNKELEKMVRVLENKLTRISAPKTVFGKPAKEIKQEEHKLRASANEFVLDDHKNDLLNDQFQTTEANGVFALECMESLFFTLDRWHKHVFSENSEDMNIFDSSMIADMDMIQLALHNKMEDIENDIEFF